MSVWLYLAVLFCSSDMHSLSTLALCLLFLLLTFPINISGHKRVMKVAIIGAGPAGLVSARHCILAGFDCDVFEQTGDVGGTWVYTDRTGLDENGLPIHSAMYKGLRTNLPKELMSFEGFSYPTDMKRSYITSEEVVSYFTKYTDYFDIWKFIKTFLSIKDNVDVKVPENVTAKPVVKRIRSHSVEFVDGSSEDIDVILYCTGYQYHFPFLSENCGIDVQEGKCVTPLYKHLVNIQHPTMAFIGLIQKVAVIPVFEVQVRFFVALLSGHFELPSKDAMLEDLKKDIEERKMRGLSLSHIHIMEAASKQAQYLDELSKVANIAPVPSVINKLFETVKMFRDTSICYKILDNDTFVNISC